MRANRGDTVEFHYIGRRADGSVFDQSHDRAPLKARLGAGQIIPGLDAALLGMEPGTEKTVTIPFPQAYGPHDPAAIQVVSRALMPPDLPLGLGTMLHMHRRDGPSVPVKIVGLSDSEVTLDANHPLAGQDLTFCITVISVG